MSSYHMVVSLKFIDRIVWEKSSITGSFRNYAISSKQEVPYKPTACIPACIPACITNLHLCRITGLSTWGQICTYLYCTNQFLWINDYLDGTWPNLRFTSVVDRLVWWTNCVSQLRPLTISMFIKLCITYCLRFQHEEVESISSSLISPTFFVLKAWDFGCY